MSQFIPTIAIIVQFSISITGTAVSTIMMDKCKQQTASTDYSIQSSVRSLSGIVAAAISGIIAEAFGYRGAFTIS